MINKILRGLKNKKARLVVAFFLFLVFFATPVVANAGDGILGWFLGWGEATIFTIFSLVLYLPIYIFGTLVSSILIPSLVDVAQYNNFLSQEGVTIGWLVVRDLANMFIVAGILLVAVGTLFNVEAYSYKKLLPKLIMGAIVINFSKMIMGLMIDISQVITLTFVKGFKDIAGGNLINAVGLDRILQLRIEGIGEVANNSAGLELLGSLFLGTVVLVVTAAVLIVLIAYFVGRIIILWIAIILSPLLFVLPFIPSGDKFASQVWGMISKQLFSGPLVAFFLWLSFTIMSVLKQHTDSIFQGGVVVENPEKFTAFISQFGTMTSVLNFIVVIGLLFTSLMMASQMGAVGGKLAGDLAGKIQGAGKWLAKTPSLAAGRKLDKWSIGAQKRMGIEKPISLRPSIIKSAWESSRKRKEDAFYKGMGVTGGMEDRFNRVLSFGKDKTFEGEVERGAYKNSEKKRISDAGVESDILLNRLDGMIKYDKDGKPVVVKGQEAMVQGVLELMMANHDINEVLLDPKLSKVFNEDGVIREGPEALEKFVKSAFRNESEERQAMIYEDLGAIGLANKDPHYYGRVSRNRDNGKAEWVKVNPEDSDDKEMIKEMHVQGRVKSDTWEKLDDNDKAEVKKRKLAATSAAYFAKKEDQAIAREFVPQNIFRQRADAKTGKRGWDPELDDLGKENLKVAVGAITGQWGRFKPEMKKALKDKDNIMAIARYAESNEVDEETRGKLYKVLDTIMDTDSKKVEDFGEREGVIERLKKYQPQEDGADNHQVEIERREEVVLDSTKREPQLQKEVDDAEYKYHQAVNSPTGGLGSPEAVAAKEIYEKKKVELETVRNAGQTAQQEIYAVHQPGAAQQLAERLDSESFSVAPAAVEEIAKNINDSIEKALTVAAGAEKPDFSGLFKDLGSNLEKLKGTLKPQKQNEIFNFRKDIGKIQGSDLQKELLGQIKLLAKNMMQASNRAPATKK